MLAAPNYHHRACHLWRLGKTPSVPCFGNPGELSTRLHVVHCMLSPGLDFTSTLGEHL